MAATRTRIAAMGMATTPPAGWDVTIYRRSAAAGEQTRPILHAATRALVAGRGDYGSGQVEVLGPDDVFVAVLDFGNEAATTALFRGLTGLPALTPDAYRPRQLQRTISGQAGVQRFFTTAGRGFCLYSVIGAFANRVPLTLRANELLGTVQLEASSL
jgi:hypothetical protein